jgi:hypothetical protein
VSETPKPDPPRSIPSLKDVGPLWLQAIAAVVGVALTALVAFGVIQNRDSAAQATTPPAGGGVAQPTVTLESVTIGTESVEASGTYSGVDASRQAVLWIGRPVEAPTAVVWIPVEADLIPDDAEPTTSSGRWRATRPGIPEGRWQWFALVGPASSGAGDQYADLRANGPGSSLVMALSEPQTSE